MSGEFNTKYNTAPKYKPEIKKRETVGKKDDVVVKQILTSSAKEKVFKLENRSVLGSEFKSCKFDPERDQFGRIL